MISKAIEMLNTAYGAEYETWLQTTDYKGIQLGDMLTQLMKTSWHKEFEKFKTRNSIILKGKGFVTDWLEPAWFVARMFAGGPPTVSQVSTIYRGAFG